jgi:CO/xanthine dehydrogenase Mo-binding subunit
MPSSGARAATPTTSARRAFLHGYVLRSPSPMAPSRSHPSRRRAAPGVHLVLTGADIAHLGDLKSGVMQKQPDGTRAPTRDIPILCRDRVRHVGDAVAFVVADTRAQAQDAAELIEIDFESEDAIAETARALDADAPLVWPEAGTNKAFTYQLGDPAEAKRPSPRPARCRGSNSPTTGWSATTWSRAPAIGEWKATRTLRTHHRLAGRLLHAPRHGRRVRHRRGQAACDHADVGGGFGTKTFVYREYPLVLEAAKRLGRPVKWTCDRTEHFMADAHGRDNFVTAEMAMDEKGRFLALRVRNIANLGAYAHQFGPFIPHVGATMSTGVYDIPRSTWKSPASTPTPARSTPIAARAGPKPPSWWRSWRPVRPRPGPRRPTKSAGATSSGRSLSLPHADRAQLRCRRVRGPHGTGHGAGRLGGLRPSGWSGRRPKARCAASAWPPISRPAPSPAPRRCI